MFEKHIYALYKPYHRYIAVKTKNLFMDIDYCICFRRGYPIILLLILLNIHAQCQTLVRVKDFGSNPGNLRMYMHTPPGTSERTKMPLVVVLHGCTQNAAKIAKQTGWNKLADTYGFRVLYPQQRLVNNPLQCFCFYRNSDIEKGKGEDYSIEQMVETVKQNYNTDSGMVFITGLSAGALMSVSVMADYPDVFNAGAIFAGGAYKTATNLWTALLTSYGWRVKSPESWAQLVRAQNPEYTGSYPRMIVYQGLMDVLVNKNNGRQIVKQWTALHHICPKPDQIIKHYAGIKAIEKDIFRDSAGAIAVSYYKVKGLGHAYLVYPGKCTSQGGHITAFSRNMKYFASYWTAVDFGLIKLPEIEGKALVQKNESGVVYKVPYNTGSNYSWKIPAGCKIMGNKNGPSIKLNWGGKAGNIDVTEINAGCKTPYPTLNVQFQHD
jgi:poly(hydroxyalkanoate) depolymerase family esterase